MIERLKTKWGVKSNFQFWIIMLVFAITGSLSAKISTPVAEWLGLHKLDIPKILYFFLKLIIVLPIYKIVLLIVGTLFGQYYFFSNFLLRMLRIKKK